MKIIEAVTQPLASLVGYIAADSQPRGYLDEVDHESLLTSQNRLWTPNRNVTAKFFGPGSVLRTNRGEIESPLVYACDGTFDGVPDASLIELGLPVTTFFTSHCDALPHWPTYRGASQEQRAL